MSELIKFKQIDCLNDWVAVVNVPMTTELELSENAQNEFNSEGVVVGIGPDAQDRGLSVGDRVITANKRYITINPKSGGYVGKDVYIMKMIDTLIRKPKGDNYEVISE
jgi:hypothetical protein